tara:strand:- start:3688 stop:3942 length:255 start_codon:yes stop_codon:yes gene_type:complete
MKVLRIDNQNVLNDRVYENLEDLRLQLCDYHSWDWQIGIDKNDKDYIDIYSLSLEDIMEHGEWDYKMITNKEANQPYYIKMYDD